MHQTYIFQGLNNKKKILALFFAPYGLHPIFCTYFFQGCKPTHFFKIMIVGVNWLGGSVSYCRKYDPIKN